MGSITQAKLINKGKCISSQYRNFMLFPDKRDEIVSVETAQNCIRCYIIGLISV